MFFIGACYSGALFQWLGNKSFDDSINISAGVGQFSETDVKLLRGNLGELLNIGGKNSSDI